MTLTYPARTTPPAVSPAEGANQQRPSGTVMTSIPESEHREAIVDGLRRLATYLDEHPDVPVGHTPVSLHYSASAGPVDDTQAFAEVDRIAELIGATPQTSPHGHYTATKVFGPVAYSVHAVPQEDKRRTEAHMSYADSVTPGGE